MRKQKSLKNRPLLETPDRAPLSLANNCIEIAFAVLFCNHLHKESLNLYEI